MIKSDNYNKKYLTWEFIEEQLKTTFKDDYKYNELIESTMFELKRKYKFPNEEDVNQNCKKSGHYGC